MKVKYFTRTPKSLYLTKKLSFTDKNKDTFYDFMQDKMKNYKKPCQSEQVSHNSPVNDETKLVELLKCPMTESELDVCPEGLKVSHIIYPRRNGIYILKEDEAIFKFDE
jgi:hypothetical protein